MPIDSIIESGLASGLRYPPTLIEGSKIILRARHVNQSVELFRLIDSNRLYLREWMPWEEQTKTTEDTREYLQKATQGWLDKTLFDYSIYDKKSEQMIGSFGIHAIQWVKRSCEIGYWICENYQGQGYVSEALRVVENSIAALGFHRISIVCDRRNHRSAQVAKKNNYLLEAVIRDDIKIRGRWRDSFKYTKLLNPIHPKRLTENLPYGYSFLFVDQATFKLLQPDLSLCPSQEVGLYGLLYYEDQIAGGIVAYEQDSKKLAIKKVYSKKAYRGRGLKGLLLRVVLNDDKIQQYSSITIEVMASSRFWLAECLIFGFTVLEIRPQLQNSEKKLRLIYKSKE